jgi:HEAT repeat protein
MRTLGIITCFALLACGCARTTPTLAGGKPVIHWVQNLKDPDPKARRHATEKLGNVGSNDPAVLPALHIALDDADAQVRTAAIVALLKCGPAAKEAAPALAEMQKKDRSAQVREYAGKALARLNDLN